MARAGWRWTVAMTAVLAVLSPLAGCDEGAAGGPSDVETDLGLLSAKADGVTLREAELSVAPGEIKRFRVTTVGFRAAVTQDGAEPAQLSVISADLEAAGDVDAAPTVETPSDGKAHTWTLRVHNQGKGRLVGHLNVLEWIPPADEPPYIGELGAELRREVVTVAPGETARFRVATTRFHAALSQSGGSVQAQLSAKHYDIDIAGAAASNPTVDAVADVDAMRNWTLRVANLGDAPLTGELVVHELRAAPSVEIGVISDIDKTVMPPEKSDHTLLPPYPGVAAVLAALELGSAGRGKLGDVYYVTARTEARTAGVAEWMAQYGVPAGGISTGVSGLPWIAQAEKVRDISAIFEAHPEQRFVVFGDTSQRDPEVYLEVIAKYPGRVVAGFIHRVSAVADPTRVGELTLIDNYAQAAAALFGVGLLDEAAARRVIAEARAEGLDLSDTEVEALLDAQRAQNATPP